MPVLNANRKKLWIAQPGADFAAELAGFFASAKKKKKKNPCKSALKK